MNADTKPFTKFEGHMIPEGSSDKPFHHIDPSCWCRPVRLSDGVWDHNDDSGEKKHLCQVGDRPLLPV